VVPVVSSNFSQSQGFAAQRDWPLNGRALKRTSADRMVFMSTLKMNDEPFTLRQLGHCLGRFARSISLGRQFSFCGPGTGRLARNPSFRALRRTHRQALRRDDDSATVLWYMTNSNSVPSNIQARGIGIRLGNDEHNRPQQPCAGSLDDFRIYKESASPRQP